ncbi:MAG: hypothetical protein RR623_09380 [Bacilli bacterium]
MKKSKILLGMFLSLSLISSNTMIYADDSVKNPTEKAEIIDLNGDKINLDAEIITIYEDLSNETAVKMKVQEIFDNHKELVIVEAIDISEQNNGNKLENISPLGNGRWVENTRSYFIGHITYATSGTISCYVVEELPPVVSGCSGTVNIYGGGIEFVSKNLYNTNKTSAYMEWVVRVTDPISGNAATLAYEVPLY